MVVSRPAAAVKQNGVSRLSDVSSEASNDVLLARAKRNGRDGSMGCSRRSSDPRMDAASKEQAVVLANNMAHKMKDQAGHPKEDPEKNEWNEGRLIHEAREIHEETDEAVRV